MSENRDESSTTSVPRTVREDRPLSPMRRTIADRLGASYRDAVHVTVSREGDAEAIVSTAEQAHEVNISLLDVVLQTASRTLGEHPAFNATFEDDRHVVYEEHNIGVAVDVEDGLVAPVIGDVGTRSLDEIAQERRRLTDRVTSGEFDMSDLRGGTFTVTNLGVLGSDSFTPVINPPEVAILGVNRLRDRPVATDDGVEVRRRMNFDLTFDHRVVDGADAARFLSTFVEFIEGLPSET